MRVDLERLLSSPLTEPPWLVHDWLPRGTMVILCGSPGVGKSYLAYSLAFSVALGEPFMGFPTGPPVPVLYLDQENSTPDMAGYAQWAWRALSCPQVSRLTPLRLEHFSLSVGWQDHLARMAREHRPGLIIIDTATPTLRVTDENDNAEAARIISDLRVIQHIAGNQTSLLILKHQRDSEDGSLVLRGAKAWVSMADQVIFHVRRRGRPRKDGLGVTRLVPEKIRRFGLRDPITIYPSWSDSSRNGLILKGELEVPRVSPEGSSE